MDIEAVFIVLIFSLAFVLIIYIIKTCIRIHSNIKNANSNNLNLLFQIDLERRKNKLNKSKIKLLNEYNDVLISRFFTIIKDILFAQKLILGKHDK